MGQAFSLPDFNHSRLRYDLSISEEILHCARFLAACRGVVDVALGVSLGSTWSLLAQ